MSLLAQWLSMGGYAPYIWTAYGLAALVLVLNLLDLKCQRGRVRKKLTSWFKSQAL